MKYVQIILAGGLLLCLANMPYGYYNLIRYVSAIVFGIMAVMAHKDGKMPFVIVYASIAVLFQPFIKFALGREIWQFVDVVAAIILVFPTVKNLFGNEKI